MTKNIELIQKLLDDDPIKREVPSTEKYQDENVELNLAFSSGTQNLTVRMMRYVHGNLYFLKIGQKRFEISEQSYAKIFEQFNDLADREEQKQAKKK